MIDFRKIVGYTDPKFPALDPTTSFYEFNSYLECCRSLGVTPSLTKFIRYNEYFKHYGSK
jgi:hypothetical protein